MGDFNKPRRDWPSYDEQGEKHLEGHDVPAETHDILNLPIDEPATDLGPQRAAPSSVARIEAQTKQLERQIDEARLRVASRKYAKTKQVDMATSYELMKSDPDLLEKWATL